MSVLLLATTTRPLVEERWGARLQDTDEVVPRLVSEALGLVVAAGVGPIASIPLGTLALRWR